MKLYKLTDQDGYTRRSQTGQTKWSAGFSMELPTIENPELCTIQVIHAYKNINLAFLLNPNHANISCPRIWEAEGNVVCEDWGKAGCFKLTTTNEIPTPAWIKSHKKAVLVRFAILCAESVLKHFEDKYSRDKRPRQAIDAAKEYIENPSFNAADAAEAADAAARAAYAAADAAASAAARAATYTYAAARAAYTASAAASAAYAAASAAYAARAATYTYTYTYTAADAYAYQIDFGKLADLAVENTITGGVK